MANLLTINLLGRLKALAGQNSEAGWALTSQVVTSGANFLTTVILIRAIGLTEFGRFTIAFLLITIVRNFEMGALLTPMSAISPKLREISRREYLGFLVVNALVFGIATSVLLMAGAWLAGSALSLGWLQDMALPLGLANFTATSAEFYRRKCFVDVRPDAAAMNDVIRYGTQIVLLAAMAFAAPRILTVETALLAIASGGLLATFVGFFRYRRMRWRRALTRSAWARHWNMMQWLTPGIFFNTIQGPGAIFFASLMFDEALIGGLRAMQNVSNLLLLPMNAMQNIATSRGATIYRLYGDRAIMAFLRKMGGVMTGSALLLAGGVYALGQPIVTIIVGDYEPALTTILVLFCIANALACLNFTLSTGLQSMEKTRPLTFAGAVAAGISIGGVLTLSSIVGVICVPVARILASIASSCVLGKAISSVLPATSTIRSIHAKHKLEQ